MYGKRNLANYYHKKLLESSNVNQLLLLTSTRHSEDMYMEYSICGWNVTLILISLLSSLSTKETIPFY